MALMFKQVSKVILFSLLAVMTSQCSNKDGLNSNFEVETIGSKQPLIRISKRKVGTGEIQPNWFDYSFNVINKSGYDVKVEEILFYVIVDGVEQPPKYFDLGLMTVVAPNGISYDYPSYCIYPNNYSSQIRMCRSSSTKANPADQGPIDNSKALTLFVGDIPDSELSMGSYQVRMEIYGVFMDSNGDDIARLVKRHFITTR